LQNAWEKARESYEQSLVIFGELGDRLGMAKTMGNLANVYCQQGNWENASECYEQSRVIFSELGELYGEAQTLANMGIFHLKQGYEAEAGVLWQEALTKLPPNLPKSKRVAEWLELIHKPNSVSEMSEGNTQTTGKTGVKPWSPLDLARNALQWFRRSEG
jgi:tetratricopeptide (TPR) repeat protein